MAIQALSFIAADSERLGRFLAVTGMGPADIRIAAREPLFLAGVLDHLVQDEKLLTTFATEANIDVKHVMAAHAVLSGRGWERDTP